MLEKCFFVKREKINKTARCIKKTAIINLRPFSEKIYLNYMGHKCPKKKEET